MATKNDPGRFDCYAIAHPDEPMFILLGRDSMAPALVRQWAEQRRAAGDDAAKIANAEACADAMEAWQKRRLLADQRSRQLQMWEAHDAPLLARKK